MVTAVCCECAEDFALQSIIRNEGEPILCSVCGGEDNNAITVNFLGTLLEPIMREHFVQGRQVKRFGEDDDEWWEQEGDSISEAVQEVLGQYFDFEDEIVEALISAENYWPGDGGEPYWDDSCSYVQTRVQVGHLYAEWTYTLTELKHNRRFFSPSAQTLFADLFDEVDCLKTWNGNKSLPVVRTLPTGTKLFRARIANSSTLMRDIFAAPSKHVGPPPPGSSRAGRMNADGVIVFYGAREEDTCLAEMRPALSNELVTIAMKTTKPLRVLDFRRLDQAFGEDALSYFQPDFTAKIEKRSFLRRLHSLISQPVVPGRESDYLITQTMAEYLAHVHRKPFDGILFASVQRTKGTNVVLFPDRQIMMDEPADSFHLSYVDGSVKLYRTTSIRYKHCELDVTVLGDGDVWIRHQTED